MNLSFYIKKLKTTDLSKFDETAKRIAAKTGKSWRAVRRDIFYCTLRYGSGHVDYEFFEMYNKNHKERDEILTLGKNNKIFKRFNDRRYIQYFEDKAIFNKKFNSFMKRDWIVLGKGKMFGDIKGTALKETDRVEGSDAEAFKAFLVGKEYIMVKPLHESCGRGIEKIKVSDWDTEELYMYLVDNDKPLAEEVVKQDKTMNLLSADSVNTIRVITILKDGKAVIVSGGIRMGKPGSVVDNFNNGGISTIYDFKTGEIISDGFDKDRNVFERVPGSGTVLKGFRIPKWDEVLGMIQEAANLVPQVGYVGWDVCISEDHGPLLIEGNSYPSQDLCQDLKLKQGTYKSITEAIK